jgi:hypothetical protein
MASQATEAMSRKVRRNRDAFLCGLVQLQAAVPALPSHLLEWVNFGHNCVFTVWLIVWLINLRVIAFFVDLLTRVSLGTVCAFVLLSVCRILVEMHLTAMTRTVTVATVDSAALAMVVEKRPLLAPEVSTVNASIVWMDDSLLWVHVVLNVSAVRSFTCCCIANRWSPSARVEEQ